MSFSFSWPRFSDQFHYDTISMLNNALNKGNKPPVIADRIEVVELEMGSQPPELEIRDIGELTMDQFRGIFRLTYNGDAHLVLKTKVQANPLNHKLPDIHILSGSRGMLAAKQPLVVPMLLRLSHFKLSSYVVLVVSKQKGITLVFKTDPLQSVDINSTFDSIAVIQSFIKREIEGQLRQMFREDLPGIIHRLSQQWVKAKVEAPYLHKQPSSMPSTPARPASWAAPSSSSQYSAPPSPSPVRSTTRPRALSGASSATNDSRRTTQASPTPPPPVPPEGGPDSDYFDPTYGLRPEGLPTKSVFRSFSSLFAPNKGLADLAEEETTSTIGDDDDVASFDMLNWDSGSVHGFTPPPSTIGSDAPTIPPSVTEYETIPAIGGGTITRPRIIHTQSMLQTSFRNRLNSFERPASPSPSLFSPRRPQSDIGYPSTRPFTPSPLSPNRSEIPEPSYLSRATHHRSYSTRPPSPESLDGIQRTRSSHSLQTPSTPSQPHIEQQQTTHKPPSEPAPETPSQFDVLLASPSSSHHPLDDPDPKIILRPASSNSLHKFSTLSHSNHTLSPYTHSVEHFTVRSVPPRPAPASQTHQDRPPPKAKRKRIFHLGKGKEKKKSPDAHAPPTSSEESSPVLPIPSRGLLFPSVSPPPSELDISVSDMDRYFRQNDEHGTIRSPSHLNRHPLT